jgi:hypothetical protein
MEKYTSEQTITYAENAGFKKASKTAPVYVTDIREGSAIQVRTKEGLETIVVKEPTVITRGLDNSDIWIQNRSNLEKNYDLEQKNVGRDDAGSQVVINYKENDRQVTKTTTDKFVPKPNERYVCRMPSAFEVKTLWSDKPLKCKDGYLVKAEDNDYYPLGADEFDKTYEFVE